MVAVGLVLLVLAVLVTIGLVFWNNESSGAEFFGLTIENISIGGMVLAGVVTGVVGTLGVALLVAGNTRNRHKRSQHKKLHATPAGADPALGTSASTQTDTGTGTTPTSSPNP